MGDVLEMIVPIVFGMVAGTLAHFGLILNAERSVSARKVVGFIMLLMTIGIVAAVLIERLEIKSATMQALIAAILTVAASEVVRWLQTQSQSVAKKLMPGGIDLKGDND